MENAESIAAVYTRIYISVFTNEKTLVAFLCPKIKLKISKVTHA